MSKHTPGPWEIEPLQGKYYGTRILLDSGVIEVWTGGSRPQKPSEREIADGWTPDVGMDHVESEEDYANACLISSAPELLDACEAAIRYDAVIQTCANDPERMSSACTAEGDDLDGLYNDWISKARAAIRKATGEA